MVNFQINGFQYVNEQQIVKTMKQLYILSTLDLKHMVKLLFLGLLIIINSGCKSSYLTEAQNFSNIKKSYAKILVVGRTESELAKRKFENKLVQALKERGINAIASYDLNFVTMPTEPSEKDLDDLTAKLIENGVDGVIVTHMVHSEQYVQQTSTPTPYARPIYYRRFRRYYVHYDPFAWDSPQLETNTRYFLESALYTLNNSPSDNLQWVGQFKISNPQNLDKTIDGYSQELVNLLVENSIAID